MTSEDFELAEKIVDWMSDQEYDGKPILHAAVCCDHIGQTRFIKAVAKIISDRAEDTPQ
jgi:hypothetical protein